MAIVFRTGPAATAVYLKLAGLSVLVVHLVAYPWP